jgi:hypothetical protein
MQQFDTLISLYYRFPWTSPDLASYQGTLDPMKWFLLKEPWHSLNPRRYEMVPAEGALA